jgi:hypothetical protein
MPRKKSCKKSLRKTGSKNLDMRVLVACEESQSVCIEFRARGHEAYSCDLQECSGGHPEWHIQDDALKVAYSQKWDLMIAHPPCTYLTNSAEWAYSDGPYHMNLKADTLTGSMRVQAREDALRFVRDLLNAPIKKKCIENPVGQISKRIFWYLGTFDEPERWEVFPTKTIGCIKPQIVQPHWFNEDASKATGLYLINLPKLKPTGMYPPRIINGKKRWSNQTDSGQNNEPPGNDRAKNRSKTFPGIARAMAEQWG